MLDGETVLFVGSIVSIPHKIEAYIILFIFQVWWIITYKRQATGFRKTVALRTLYAIMETELRKGIEKMECQVSFAIHQSEHNACRYFKFHSRIRSCRADIFCLARPGMAGRRGRSDWGASVIDRLAGIVQIKDPQLLIGRKILIVESDEVMFVFESMIRGIGLGSYWTKVTISRTNASKADFRQLARISPTTFWVQLKVEDQKKIAKIVKNVKPTTT